MKTKVTPVNYIGDLKSIMQDEKCDAVGIDKMSITYIQPADTWSSSDDIQTITITSQCADCCGVKKQRSRKASILTLLSQKDIGL